MSNFDFDSLTCDSTLLPTKNNPSSAKDNCIFLRKGREDRALTLTYLDSPIVKVFLERYLYILILATFRWYRGFKVGPKVQTLGLSGSCKKSNFSKVLQKLFLSFKTLVQISAKLDHICGSKG